MSIPFGAMAISGANKAELCGVSGVPAGRGIRQDVNLSDSENCRRVNPFRPRIFKKSTPQKPKYVNTVWGYGYKWGE